MIITPKKQFKWIKNDTLRIKYKIQNKTLKMNKKNNDQWIEIIEPKISFWSKNAK